MKEVITDILSNPKVSSSIAGATAAVGTGQWFEWIPSDIGKMASLLGIVATVMVLVINVPKLYEVLTKPFKKKKKPPSSEPITDYDRGEKDEQERRR